MGRKGQAVAETLPKHCRDALLANLPLRCFAHFDFGGGIIADYTGREAVTSRLLQQHLQFVSRRRYSSEPFPFKFFISIMVRITS